MKLAALGVVTAAIGIGLGLPGLIGIGIWWALIGPVMRRHGKHLLELQEAAGGQPPDDPRTFAFGTLLWVLLGLPSLLVGILETGIDADHESWRWLPFGMGVLALGLGGLAGILYLVGSGLGGARGGTDVAKTPATLRIRSVKETGTFVNEHPRLEFVFGVEPDASTGVAAYEVTKKATVPFTALSYLRIGEGFRATVAGPEAPTSMDIRWDEPVPVQTPPGDTLPT